MLIKERKIAIMGYRSVGKSSLSMQYVDSQFDNSYDPTIQNTFVKTTVLNNQEYEMQLIDTAGQDEYSILLTQHFLGYHGYILVFSVTSLKSFIIIQIIYNKLLYMTGNMHVPIILVGNKTDLDRERVVSKEEGHRLANSWNTVYVEASAKQTKCASNVFHTMLLVIEKHNKSFQQKSGCIIS